MEFCVENREGRCLFFPLQKHLFQLLIAVLFCIDTASGAHAWMQLRLDVQVLERIIVRSQKSCTLLPKTRVQQPFRRGLSDSRCNSVTVRYCLCNHVRLASSSYQGTYDPKAYLQSTLEKLKNIHYSVLTTGNPDGLDVSNCQSPQEPRCAGCLLPKLCHSLHRQSSATPSTVQPFPIPPPPNKPSKVLTLNVVTTSFTRVCM
jgi:hypothetical protein